MIALLLSASIAWKMKHRSFRIISRDMKVLERPTFHRSLSVIRPFIRMFFWNMELLEDGTFRMLFWNILPILWWIKILTTISIQSLLNSSRNPPPHPPPPSPTAASVSQSVSQWIIPSIDDDSYVLMSIPQMTALDQNLLLDGKISSAKSAEDTLESPYLKSCKKALYLTDIDH